MNTDFLYNEVVYPTLSRDRVIFVAEDITKESAASLCAQLLYYDKQNNEDIHLFINTNGGDVLALSAIYDMISIINSDVSTIGFSKVYSAGLFLLASGTKGKRYMFKHAEAMLHGIQCTYPELPLADQVDSKIYYDYLSSLNKRILRIFSESTGQAMEQVEKDAKRDLFFSSKEALKYGIIDSII